jgi:dolichyl-phosphate-mannose-protein mannosyltransferase
VSDLPTPSDGPIRRAITVAVLWLSIAAGVWTVALILFGGVDARIAGLKITSNDFRRSLLIGALFFAAFILAGGDVRGSARRSVWFAPVLGATMPRLRQLWTWLRRVDARVLAGLLALSVLVVLSTWRLHNVGGSDAYGYLSQADLWLGDRLDVPQPWVDRMPFPDPAWAFSPLGYRPRPDGTLVPTYSPGLPMMMAAMKFVAGHCSVFLLSPICGALLVLATFGIGRQLGSSRVGLVGAWLVATSPPVLDMGIIPMSDVPVAALWAGAFWLLLRGSAWSALGAGLLTALAILVRTNLAPMAAVCWFWLAYVAWRAEGEVRRRRLNQLAAFTLGVLPGPIIVALLNSHWYGSPFKSGYGHLKDLYAAARVPQNIRNYTLWLVETQTAFFFAGVAALFLPLRRLWPYLEDRSIVIAFGLFAFGVWFLYMFWEIFDSAAYLRFLLPAYPFIMIGLATVVHSLLSLRLRVLTAVTCLFLVWFGYRAWYYVGSHGFFELAKSDTKFELAGRIVARAVPANSVVMTMQHSGTIRYYGGRLTMRYDQLDDNWLDRAVEWFSREGVGTYAWIEDWEVPEFRRNFPTQRLGKLAMQPVIEYHNASAVMYLYDLNRPAHETDVETIVETFDGPPCLKPAPRVRVPFK